MLLRVRFDLVFLLHFAEKTNRGESQFCRPALQLSTPPTAGLLENSQYARQYHGAASSLSVLQSIEHLHRELLSSMVRNGSLLTLSAIFFGGFQAILGQRLRLVSDRVHATRPAAEHSTMVNTNSM